MNEPKNQMTDTIMEVENEDDETLSVDSLAFEYDWDRISLGTG